MLSPQTATSKRFSFHIPTGLLKGSNKPKNASLHRHSTFEESASRIGTEQDKKYRQMMKFHEKLSSLIQEVEGHKEDVDLKTAWRFVKNVVHGYVDSKQKIKKLEAIINAK